MKYFLHDSNAFNDEKITEIFLQFGYEGVGLFYVLLEKIASQEKPIKTVVLKSQLKVGKKLEKCWSFMEQIGVISSTNGETFNKRILSYSEKYKIKNKKARERIKKFRANHIENETVTKNVTHNKSVTKQGSNAPKVKESKVKESNREREEQPTPKNFKQLTDKEFQNEIATYKQTYPSDTLRSFYNYWGEKSAAGKMKFQLEETWELDKRLITWKNREGKFGNGKIVPILEEQKLPSRLKKLN